jgi:hypothetical protein
MELKNFIATYDETMSLRTISSLIRILVKKENFFLDATVGDPTNFRIDKKVRNVKSMNIESFDSMTSIHWYNFLHTLFTTFFQRYR